MSFDDQPAEPSAPAAMELRRERAPGSPWLTTELAILRQHYPQGAKAVQALLQHRTLACIRSKAASEGIKGNRRTTMGMRWSKIHATRPDIDMAIREGYINATAKGDIKRLAERLQRPAWWVQKRAASLGVTRTNRTRLDAWLPAELQILETYAAAGLDVITTKLRQAGYKRTATGVSVQMKRRQIDRVDPDVWSANQLGPLFGVDPSTVVGWITRRGLVAKRYGEGMTNRYMVHRRELRRWMRSNLHLVDLRRIDQAWFREVMFPPTGAAT